MQPLIQHIFSQIFKFPQKFNDFSCKSCTWKENKTGFTSKYSFWSEVHKNCHFFPSVTFAIFIGQHLWLWSRIGSRVKMSHYIQPSISLVPYYDNTKDFEMYNASSKSLRPNCVPGVCMQRWDRNYFPVPADKVLKSRW